MLGHRLNTHSAASCSFAGECAPISRVCFERYTGLPTSAEVLRSDPRASGKSPAAFLLSDLGVDRYVPICIPHRCAPVLDSDLPPGIRARTPHAPPKPLIL